MATAAPSRLTASEFRKIDLQSPSDLAYLQAQTQRAAREKIDAAFPPSAAPTDGEDDGMRRRVEELVQAFVEKTWEGVRWNVTCNGVDMDAENSKEATDEFEPLDVKLAEKIRTLEVEKERLTLKVTGLRRDAPAKAAENVKARWTAEEESFEAALDGAREKDGEEGVELDVGGFKRWDEVQAAYGQSIDALVRLRTELTESVAKLQRARGVAAYVEEQRLRS
ncbi:uncharacterized protein PV09_05708 [Verruconis gallopava]|uniref:Kinetochore protein mis14 n=1 Tax=Verruconis gallopava TaxID=253628 RepID=A0A0D2AVA8_9PEZI|nr:uncharacterized protein PV09_05708 [Verruconis gallopava]KIW03059.1 hypothetical protein PV09_05708 [Verruconis gallopava]